MSEPEEEGEGRFDSSDSVLYIFDDGEDGMSGPCNPSPGETPPAPNRPAPRQHADRPRQTIRGHHESNSAE